MKNYVDVTIEYAIHVFWGKNLWSNYNFLLFSLKLNAEMKNCVLIFCACCTFRFSRRFLSMIHKIFRVADLELNIDFHERLMALLCDASLFTKKLARSRLWKHPTLWETKISRRINKLMSFNEKAKYFTSAYRFNHCKNISQEQASSTGQHVYTKTEPTIYHCKFD